jgi:hypothetical protein
MFVKGRQYEHQGHRVTYLRSFNSRGIVRRFSYGNGQIIDFSPGDELPREWSDVPNDGFDWRSLVGAERFT